MKSRIHNMGAWWGAHGLKIIVFVTGAAILVIEITATRILSPFYGNTIYTVSSVISVILGALAIGYARGGKRADRTPTYYEFYRIIFWGGISILILTILALFVLPVGGDFFSLRVGPLFWSLVLFFPSGYLMGMLSPFAIKLAHQSSPNEGLGELSGNIFFWSTTGSIAGSLLAGFVLIPGIGITSILFAVTVTIMLIGALGMRAHGTPVARREIILRLILILLFVAFVFSLTRVSAIDPRTRLVKDGVYERQSVLDTIYAGRPARFFLQDRSASGGMFLDGAEQTFAYTTYADLYRVTTPNLSAALIIGGGIYTIPKALHERAPTAIIDVVDIEPSLEVIARDYFQLSDTPLIRTHVMDGRRFLRETKTTYDLIVSDVYHSLYSIPAHFTTKEFFRSAQSRLSPQGIFIANIIGSSRKTPESLLFSEIRTMESVFPAVYVFAVNDPTDLGIQNFILVGMNNTDTPLPLLLAEHTDPFLRSLATQLYDGSHISLAPYPILTDDFAPVDHLVSLFMNEETAAEKRTAGVLAQPARGVFSGERAIGDIKTIVSLGTRAIGTRGNTQLGMLITEKLRQSGITVATDQFVHTKKDGARVTLSNIVGRINPEATRRVVVGTHYDSIVRAYRDANEPNGYMPGANNSASGVALLLEAAGLISEYVASSTGVDIIFFDGEEGETALGAGDPNWSPLGSTHFASRLGEFYPNGKPGHALLFDMVCDSDLQIYQEMDSSQSAPKEQELFFSIGGAYAPTVFIHKEKWQIGDDHTPFLKAGIPAFLIIDFDYEPWFNTTKDTPERCSPHSLEIVGTTLLHHLQAQH